MECENCGQYSDWIGADSGWRSVNGPRSAVALLECEVCGNRQHKQ